MLIYLGYTTIINSGVLFSGDETFNALEKYSVVINNYEIESSLFGIIFAICLGAGTIGPDLLSNNIYVLLTSYHSKGLYYLFSCITCWLYYFFVQILVTVDTVVIMNFLGIKIEWMELLELFRGIVMNASVLFVITSLFSIFMKGYKSVVGGIVAYSFYYIYTFNMIPFINEYVSFDVSKYKDVLL